MFELFHDLAQSESAAVRRFIVEHGHKGRVSFRNVSYDEVQADFIARGGTTTPALWDGARLWTGADAVMDRLGRA